MTVALPTWDAAAAPLVEVAFRVQAHPQRRELAEALAAAIGGEVCWDPDPDAPRRSPWRTFERILRDRPASATHVLQIQDDATVCPYFHETVEAAVRARPDRLLVFFVAAAPAQHAQRVLQACARDEPWAELDHAHWCPAVCTCWPVALADQMLQWYVEQRYPDVFTADDELIGRFLRAAEHRPLAAVPSLAEHADCEPSLIGRRTAHGADPARVAVCWIGDCDECTDPRTIQWNAGPGGIPPGSG